MSNQAPSPKLIRAVALFLVLAAATIVTISLLRDQPFGDGMMNFVLAGLLVVAAGGLLAASRRPQDS